MKRLVPTSSVASFRTAYLFFCFLVQIAGPITLRAPQQQLYSWMSDFQKMLHEPKRLLPDHRALAVPRSGRFHPTMEFEQEQVGNPRPKRDP